jgi:hypothetical protein
MGKIMNCSWQKQGIAFSLILFLASFFFSHGADADLKTDYSRLVEFIEIEDKQQPLHVFRDFENELDEESHRAALDQLNRYPDLIQRIKNDLGGKSLRWRLADFEYRLLFVPEKRPEYAALYESYCQDVIHDLLDMTNLKNPYKEIRTLTGEESEISESPGLDAFLVHNLVKEFSGTYVFFNKKQKKIKIRLKGKIFSGEVGFYSSNLTVNGEGAFEFVNDSYTIWQNSSKNPYTTLMVPIEETLHVLLREYTQQAIIETLEKESIHDLKGARRIAADWISVEEAVVGGLVYSLMPKILNNYLDAIPVGIIQKDLETKYQIEKYRHLKKGIEIVVELGYQKALKMYKADPNSLRELLI